MSEKQGFTPPSIDSQYMLVHPSNIPPEQLAEMKREIAEQGVWQGKVTQYGESTGAVEIIEPERPGGLLRIMPAVVKVPHNHPSRIAAAPAEPSPTQSRDGENDRSAQPQADREAQKQAAREQINRIDWNERSTPIYRPEDVNTAVPGSSGDFNTLLRIKAAELSVQERIKFANVLRGRQGANLPLTPRLVRDPDQELLGLLESAWLPDGTYDAKHKSEVLRGSLNAQLEAQEFGPTEFTPEDAKGQEVAGYAIVDGWLVNPGRKGPGNTRHLVIFTSPSEMPAS